MPAICSVSMANGTNVIKATSFVIIPIIYEMIYSSLTQIDSTVTDDIKTLTNNNFNVIMRFYIPLIIPSIVTSVVQSFGLGLKVMLMAEYISPRTNTFGAEINRYYMNNQMEYVFAIIIINLAPDFKVIFTILPIQ